MFGLFKKFKDGFAKTVAAIADTTRGLFGGRKIDAASLDQLEEALYTADFGVETTTEILDEIRAAYRKDPELKGKQAAEIGATVLQRVLAGVEGRSLVGAAAPKPTVIAMIGVNGSGKTTTIGKLASRLRGEGRSVMIAAGDTFRAAAIDQLKVWGERTGVPVVSRPVGSDASGLAFDALKEAQGAGTDVLLIDTAGRLQNKQALMDELEKVIRVLRKLDPSAPHDVLLVLDATTGQNALSQVEVFKEKAGVTGLVMTKLDGTARGGILVAIAAKHGLPVHAIGVGEGVDDLQAFDAGEFARAIAVG